MQERKEEGQAKQKREEKTILNPNYYLPCPIYVPSFKEKTPALVNNLIPDLTLEGSKNISQNMKEVKIVEDRRVVVEVTDEEDDLDSYSDSDYIYQIYE